MAEYSTVAEVMAAYERGERLFQQVRIEHADLRGRRLHGAWIYESSLRGANFDRAGLSDAEFFNTDLTDASLAYADLNRAGFVTTTLTGVQLPRATLTMTDFLVSDLRGADLTGCELEGAHFSQSDLGHARFDGAILGSTAFTDTDVSPLCDAVGLNHASPSFVDLRSVLRSYRHPGLKRFLVDCGVPPVVAEYTIAAAEAEGDGLQTLMRSTFISYGAPDEPFARRLSDELRDHHVVTFFFPENARPGRRIGDEVHSRIQEHDRVILVCSRESLNRPGVRNEIQETFDREARDGGATYLLPIRLDDYVLTEWDDPLAERVRDRVVADFRGAMNDDAVFEKGMKGLLAELRKALT